MKKPKQALLVIVALAVILPVATLLIPVPEHPVGTVQQFRAANITTVLFAWLHLGAAGLFLLGMKDFKERLRPAYRAICVGLVVLGLTQLQYPVLSTFELWLSDWVTKYAGLSLLSVIAAAALFLGIRSFARILNDRSWWTSLSVLPAVGVIGLVGCLVWPGQYRLEAAGSFVYTVLSVVNAIQALRIKQRLGPAYTNAMAWFFLGLSATAASGAMLIVFDNLHIERGPILGIPAALAGICLVKAGYAFNKIKDY